MLEGLSEECRSQVASLFVESFSCLQCCSLIRNEAHLIEGGVLNMLIDPAKLSSSAHIEKLTPTNDQQVV
jgi:hypothetical protein